MNSIRISIYAKETEQEMLISELIDLEAEGFEQTSEMLIAYFPEPNFNSYDVQAILKDRKFEINTVSEQNWNEVWESHFEPVMIEDFCLVRADFHATVKDVKHEIIITPKMSFGTGHHATTYMMIARMKELDFQGKNVFDFGTGTGILAIMAEKQGAASINAVDIDIWSIENAADNIEKNFCTKINLWQSNKVEGNGYDFILANINRNILLDNMEALGSALKKEGKLLLSGLLPADEEIIEKACMRQGLFLIKKSERNNWIALLYGYSSVD
ncbi:MAG: 50S ribosomal protein L11 methyltransferase [Flavisolibacter sp.]